MKKTTSKTSHNRQIILVLDFIALCVPLALVIIRFDSLVKAPVNALATKLPIALLLPLLPRFFDTGISDLLRSLTQLIFIFIPAFYLLVVLMGAPFTTHVSQTILLSAHIAAMAAFRPLICFGLVRRNWLPLISLNKVSVQKKVEGLRCTLVRNEGIFWGTLAGAYLGAIPIPLDWDRDWQAWPITVYTGACLGLAVGGIAQLLFEHLYLWISSIQTKGTETKKSQ